MNYKRIKISLSFAYFLPTFFVFGLGGLIEFPTSTVAEQILTVACCIAAGISVAILCTFLKSLSFGFTSDGATLKMSHIGKSRYGLQPLLCALQVMLCCSLSSHTNVVLFILAVVVEYCFVYKIDACYYNWLLLPFVGPVKTIYGLDADNAIRYAYFVGGEIETGNTVNYKQIGEQIAVLRKNI